MDHRVSKDMISSGMTPSGKKTQADLGKTQYGSAPSPNRLMDAYHSMYQNQKEETLDEKMGDMADFASRNIKGARGAAKASTPTPKPSGAPNPKTEVFRGNVVNSKTGEPIRKASMIDKVRDRRGKIEDKEGITARREKVQGIMNKYGESVDLLSAYQSIYADTFEEGKMPAGLQAYLDKKKGKKKDDDNGDVEKEGKKKDKKDMKEGAGLYANIHAKRKRGGKMRKKGAKGAPSSQDFANAAKTAKEETDLFDSILNHYVNEGYDEKDVIQAMSSLTEEQLQEAGPLAALAPLLGKIGITAKGGAAAAKGAAAAAKGAAGTAKVTTSGGATFSGGAAKLSNMQKLKGAVKTIAKNPLVQGQVVGAASQKLMEPGEKVNKTGQVGAQRAAVAASADLFDIVKGQLLDEGLSEEEIRDIMLELTPEEIMNEMNQGPSTPVKNYGDSPNKPKILPNFGATRAVVRTTDKGTVIKGGKDTGKTAAQLGMEGPRKARKRRSDALSYDQVKSNIDAKEEYKGSGTPEQQAAMKAQIEVSKKVNRYGGKTPSGTTSVDAKKGIEDVRKSIKDS